MATKHLPENRMAADTDTANAVRIIDWLFPPPRAFAVRLWEGTTLPAKAGACLVLNHPAALRSMFSPPVELSLAEAFIRGDFEVEGDIFSVFLALEASGSLSFSLSDLARLFGRIRTLPRPVSKNDNNRGPARLRGQVHSRRRDKAAVQYHYDVGNQFFSLWLDPWMQYSCAYFGTGAEDLETAQTRKLELICRKLHLKSGERLLDIGCGWGGLAVYAAKNYDVRVLGITLSKEQASHANLQIVRAGLGSRAAVKLCDYREIGPEFFDKIVSVGMFEHVGERQLPEYFARAYQHLKPGGLFLNHGIARRAPWLHKMNRQIELCCSPDMRPPQRSFWQKFFERRILGRGAFIQRYVFPDAELLPVSRVNLLAEQAGFEVRDVENLREHYALTLRHWVHRLEECEVEAIDMAGKAVFRTWRLYMAASAHGFSTGRINVNQTLLAKPEAGRSGLPLTRAVP